MIGCVILGGLAALGAAKLVHACRCAHGHGGCGGWGHRGWGGGWHGYADELGGPMGGPATGAWPGRGGGARFVLGHVLARVRATPAQERAITAAWSELRDELERVRGEGRRTRTDIAAALRKPAFDEVLLGELYARHDRTLEELRKGLVGFLAKTHDALEDEQRQALADLIESGLFRDGLRGGFRGGW